MTTSPLHLHPGDCLTVLPTLEADSIDLCFADPPYNIGIFKKMPEADYLAWCEEWVGAVSRVLKPNGAFWVSHKNPRMLTDISRMVDRCGRGLVNWVTWDKFNGNPTHQCGGGPMVGMTQVKSLRSFQVMAEYPIYHADEGNWIAQCDKERGFIFEPLRAYLDEEKEQAGFTTRQVAEAFQKKTGSQTVTGMAGHWLSNVQWCLPTEENYQWLRDLFNSDGDEHLRREYEHLQREYEDLRREYEDLRYTFNNPGKTSSVWQVPPAQRNWHPTPKPLALLERIIEATSNPGGLVLDPFFGSGTTGKAALGLGRRCIGIDTNEDYCEKARRDIELMLAQLKLL